MEQTLNQLYQTLQKLVGLHRQLLDTVRMEREALVAADKKAIQDAIYAKEALIEAVRQRELERLQQIQTLAALWGKEAAELTLSQVIIQVQGREPKRAEQLRSAYNALTVLIQRITEQNADNGQLVQRSLEHIQNMKRNVLDQSAPHAQTYTQQGQTTGGTAGARLFSQEA